MMRNRYKSNQIDAESPFFFLKKKGNFVYKRKAITSYRDSLPLSTLQTKHRQMYAYLRADEPLSHYRHNAKYHFSCLQKCFL